MENLTAEYFTLIDIIGQYDGYLMMIKGWSITVGITIIGYAFQQGNKSILLMCIVSSLCFYLMDAKFKEYQVSYYPRMKAIEYCVDSPYRISERELNMPTSCEIFKIDRSWTETKSKGSFVDNFVNFGVAFPHFILLLLAMFLYFNPQWLAKKTI
ncbi:hypothetical protein [Enterovibrio calviensis]|uniref:hypothetical protein n=1 Tax=Enterovibrio calviensis TaxID=91359 RepID=UPI0004841E3F|nr:hypothetical protein [Enterovibrio calviensis]